MGTNKASVFRHLASLTAAGYASQQPESGRYVATFKVAAIGLRKLETSSVGQWVQPRVDALATATKELVRFAMVDGAELRWVAAAQGAASRVILAVERDRFLPLHATASGKAWLATLGEEPVRRMLASASLPRYTAQTIVTVDALLAELARVRQRGYALNLGEDDESVYAMAAPVVGNGSPAAVGTISIAAPAPRLTAAHIERYAPLLRATTDSLSDEIPVLGYLARHT